MNEKEKKKEYKTRTVTYIGRDRSFLKNWENLTLEHFGKPLDEFIAADFQWVDVEGIEFDINGVRGLSVGTCWNLLGDEMENDTEEEKEEKEICLQDSEIFLVVYTQCQIKDVILFFVWHFQTQMVTESREAWEAKYGLVPGACCLKNFATSSSPDSRQEEGRSSEQEALIDTATKKCQFKNQYVACSPTVFPHFVNPENPKAVEFLKNHPLNIPVNMDLTFGPLKDTPEFCYGGEKPGLCTSLYDSLVVDDPFGVRTEHNMANFFSDAFATCFIYQNAIKPVTGKVETITHSLLGVSMYF
jgi:hypothetical protein